VNELRVAGVLGRRKRRAARNRLLAGQPAEPPLLELERAAPSQQPQLLLQLVTTALAEQDRLPPARALTVQELTRAARLPQESDREHLRQLATVCERVRFSDGEPVPQLLAAALRHGRELLAALESASRQPQAAS
jgi:hypothetical protein